MAVPHILPPARLDRIHSNQPSPLLPSYVSNSPIDWMACTANYLIRNGQPPVPSATQDHSDKPPSRTGVSIDVSDSFTSPSSSSSSTQTQLPQKHPQPARILPQQSTALAQPGHPNDHPRQKKTLHMTASHTLESDALRTNKKLRFRATNHQQLKRLDHVPEGSSSDTPSPAIGRGSMAMTLSTDTDHSPMFSSQDVVSLMQCPPYHHDSSCIPQPNPLSPPGQHNEASHPPQQYDDINHSQHHSYQSQSHQTLHRQHQSSLDLPNGVLPNGKLILSFSDGKTWAELQYFHPHPHSSPSSPMDSSQPRQETSHLSQEMDSIKPVLTPDRQQQQHQQQQQQQPSVVRLSPRSLSRLLSQIVPQSDEGNHIPPSNHFHNLSSFHFPSPFRYTNSMADPRSTSIPTLHLDSAPSPLAARPAIDTPSHLKTHSPTLYSALHPRSPSLQTTPVVPESHIIESALSFLPSDAFHHIEREIKSVTKEHNPGANDGASPSIHQQSYRDGILLPSSSRPSTPLIYDHDHDHDHDQPSCTNDTLSLHHGATPPHTCLTAAPNSVGGNAGLPQQVHLHTSTQRYPDSTPPSHRQHPHLDHPQGHLPSHRDTPSRTTGFVSVSDVESDNAHESLPPTPPHSALPLITYSDIEPTHITTFVEALPTSPHQSPAVPLAHHLLCTNTAPGIGVFPITISDNAHSDSKTTSDALPVDQVTQLMASMALGPSSSLSPRQPDEDETEREHLAADMETLSTVGQALPPTHDGEVQTQYHLHSQHTQHPVAPIASKINHHRRKKNRIDKIRVADISIMRKIGEGSFGEIFQGTLWGQEVALKKLRIKDSGHHLGDFKKEVRIMRTLRHPNIVEFLGACIEPETSSGPGCYIITEYLRNGSLEDVLAKYAMKGKAPSLQYTISMAKDIARGLNWLHHKGIIHRDLKTANILVDHSWRGKIADFGLSHMKQRSSTKKKSKFANVFGSTVGTRCYMAPEVLRKERYSLKADVFSYGIVICELLTGHYPFDFSDVALFKHYADLTATKPLPVEHNPVTLNDDVNPSFPQHQTTDHQQHQEQSSMESQSPPPSLTGSEQHVSSKVFESAIINGLRPPIPLDIPPSLFDLLVMCWSSVGSHRPSMDAIMDQLLMVEQEYAKGLTCHGIRRQFHTQQQLQIQQRYIALSQQLGQFQTEQQNVERLLSSSNCHPSPDLLEYAQMIQNQLVQLEHDLRVTEEQMLRISQHVYKDGTHPAPDPARPSPTRVPSSTHPNTHSSMSDVSTSGTHQGGLHRLNFTHPTLQHSQADHSNGSNAHRTNNHSNNPLSTHSHNIPDSERVILLFETVSKLQNEIFNLSARYREDQIQYQKEVFILQNQIAAILRDLTNVSAEKETILTEYISLEKLYREQHDAAKSLVDSMVTAINQLQEENSRLTAEVNSLKGVQSPSLVPTTTPMTNTTMEAEHGMCNGESSH